MISCLEEIAYHMGFIGGEQLKSLAAPMKQTAYGQYLLDLLEREHQVPTPDSAKTLGQTGLVFSRSES